MIRADEGVVKCGSCEGSTATVECEHCGPLCDSCSKQLHANRALRSHAPSPLPVPLRGGTPTPAAAPAGPGTTACEARAAEARPAARCGLHKQCDLDMFCSQDSELVCARCLLLGPHRDPSTGVPHACVTIEEAEALRRAAVADELAFVSKLGGSIGYRKAEIISAQGASKLAYETVKGAIREHFDTLREALECRQAKLISEADRLYKDQDATFNELLASLEVSGEHTSQARLALQQLDSLTGLSFLQSHKQVFEARVSPCHSLQLPSVPPLDVVFCPSQIISAEQIATSGEFVFGISLSHSSFTVTPTKCDLGPGAKSVITVEPCFCDRNGRPVMESFHSKLAPQVQASFLEEPDALSPPPLNVKGWSVEVGPFEATGNHQISIKLHPLTAPAVTVPVQVHSSPKFVIAVGRSTGKYPGFRMVTEADLNKEPMKRWIFSTAKAHGGGLMSLESFTPSNVCRIQGGYVQFGGEYQFLQATKVHKSGSIAPQGNWNVCYLYPNTDRPFSKLRKQHVSFQRSGGGDDTEPALFVTTQMF
ncbi:hypothetical protein Pelo_10846 [Pelomyxa schiedti]|nr:hypothetical protein Pelo_10846 [Pelomyxa schiedti]